MSRDTEVLCQSLTYEQGLPHILDGEEIQQYTVAYTPPFDEFEVFKVDMPAGASTLVPASLVRPIELAFVMSRAAASAQSYNVQTRVEFSLSLLNACNGKGVQGALERVIQHSMSQGCWASQEANSVSEAPAFLLIKRTYDPIMSI